MAWYNGSMHHTEETKQRLSEMRRGERNPFFGKHHTPETRTKLAAVLRRYNALRQYSISRLSIIIPEGSELAYFAGLVDGEGSIGFSKGRPYIAIYNSSAALLGWIESHTVSSGRGKWVDFRGRVPGWQWRIDSAVNVYRFALALLPLLVIKRAEAAKVVTYLEAKYGDRLKD